MNTQDEIKHAFTPVGKIDQVKMQKVLRLQTAAQMLAEEFLDLCPPCADRTFAIRQILTAKFFGVQAITHEQTPNMGIQACKQEAQSGKKETEKTQNQQA